MKSVKGVQFVIAFLLTASAAFAQLGFDFFGPPAKPGMDLSGDYAPGRAQDADLGTAAGMMVDYGGIPLNEGSRLYALAWNASRITLRQHQCAGYVPPYFFVAPGNYRIWEERDKHTQQLVAIHMYTQIPEGLRTIWMDGRPHPPVYAQHTWSGFSTGKWDGNILTVYTTHIKRGWIRAPASPKATKPLWWSISSGTATASRIFPLPTIRLRSPKPTAKTSELSRFLKDPGAWLYACDDGEQISAARRTPPKFRTTYGAIIPLSANIPRNTRSRCSERWAAQTMYPEFQAKLKDPAAADAAAIAEIVPSGPGGSRRGWTSKNPTARSTCCRFRATSTCWWATAPISPFRSATKAPWWSIPATAISPTK